MSEKICQTCLSSERKLRPIRGLQYLLHKVNILQMISPKGGMCWECYGIVQKFAKFQIRILEAQQKFACFQSKTFTSLSNLSVETKDTYNYEFNHDLDPLNPEKEIEEKEIKEEYNDSDNDFDKELYEADEVRKRKTRKENEEDVKEKFVTVMLTEEEMLKNREDKRNQPNFKKIPFKCDSCVLGFTRKETYDLHMKKKHDESIGQYACDVCAVRFGDAAATRCHRRKHFTTHRCRLCGHETRILRAAIAHCRYKHATDTWGSLHCDQCAAIAGTPEDLAEHIRTQHTLYCNECGEKFKGKHTLRTHKLRIHTAKRDYICDICNRTFKTKTRLESHMVTHNSTLAKKLAFCVVCNVQYKNIYVYRNHLKNSANHSERSYQCADCNKKFASKVYWQKHCDFYHLHKSQYKCEICNKLFISDWRLKNHRQTHHGLSRSRNHSCNVCGKKFFTLSTLRGHQLTHSEQRSYMCEDCGDTFKQRPALYTHSRLVHKGRKKVKS